MQSLYAKIWAKFLGHAETGPLQRPYPKRFPEWIETGTVGVQALKFTLRRSFSENRGKIKAVIASGPRATASSRRTALPVPNVREAVVEMISVVRTHFTMDLIR